MPQSLSNVLIHLVFSTKDRQPLINDEVRPKLHAYIVGILKNLDCPSVQVGGPTDHVHALFVLHRTKSVSEIVEEVKKSSSKWMKTQGVPTFAWQAGYGAFSVSESLKDSVIDYIENQMEHHKRISFQDEFRKFLVKHGIKFDERYLWE